MNGNCLSGYYGSVSRTCTQSGSNGNWGSISGSCDGISFFLKKKNHYNSRQNKTKFFSFSFFFHYLLFKIYMKIKYK
mgnify:CR=1 FL=1